MTTDAQPLSPQLRAVAWVATRIVAPSALVLGGVFIAGSLMALRGGAETRAPAELVIPVTLAPVAQGDHAAHIFATGVVQPEQSVNLVPEVAGRVVWIAPGLVRGAVLRKGEVLARLDDRDQVAALEAEKARLVQAELELQLERNRQRIAAREWSSLGDASLPDAEQQLALRKPHLAVAEQSVASAKAAVARAELNVARTRLVAPFDAAVINETLDVGQVVAPGAAVASLIGTGALRVEASIPSEQLAFVELPRQDGGAGSSAEVVWRLPDASEVRATGEVIQRVAQLDAATRTGTVVVAIKASDAEEGTLPLLPNALVTVNVSGRLLSDVARVPRAALDGPDHLWVADSEGRLARRPVTVVWREPEHVLMRDGLEAGDRVVVSPLSMPVAGVRVRETAVDPTAAQE